MISQTGQTRRINVKKKYVYFVFQSFLIIFFLKKLIQDIRMVRPPPELRTCPQFFFIFFFDLTPNIFFPRQEQIMKDYWVWKGPCKKIWVPFYPIIFPNGLQTFLFLIQHIKSDKIRYLSKFLKFRGIFDYFWSNC